MFPSNPDGYFGWRSRASDADRRQKVAARRVCIVLKVLSAQGGVELTG